MRILGWKGDLQSEIRAEAKRLDRVFEHLKSMGDDIVRLSKEVESLKGEIDHEFDDEKDESKHGLIAKMLKWSLMGGRLGLKQRTEEIEKRMNMLLDQLGMEVHHEPEETTIRKKRKGKK